MELSTVLYYQDRAVREQHFFQLDMDARRALAEPPEPGEPTAEQQISHAALSEFLAEYDLPELQPRVPPEAAAEYLADLKAGRVPRWAQKAVKVRELRAAARRCRS